MTDDLFRCPRCDGALASLNACGGCGVTFPRLGDVPVLVPDAEAAMQRWRLRTRQFAAGVAEGVASARAELARVDLLPSTRERIARSCDALADNRERVLTLLADAGIVPAGDGEGELETDERASAAGYRSITEYYEQLHRDWSWGDDGAENAVASSRAREALGDEPLGVVVVLGSGACRLAYDLHHATSPAASIAIDINPLSSIVAAKMVRGERLSLYEFPLIPRDIGEVHVLRELSAPHGAVDGLHVVVADAFLAPLADGAADTVVTPWFIDQVPDDARDAIGVVHRLLKPGGRWLNFGPLIYPKDRPYRARYTPSELVELIALSGFDVVSSRLDMLEFLRSPSAGFARIEQVMTSLAVKQAGVEGEAWLIAPHLPVPRFDGLATYRAPHPLLGYVAAMIDGRASLREITRRVIREHAIPKAVAEPGVPAAAAEIARHCRGDLETR